MTRPEPGDIAAGEQDTRPLLAGPLDAEMEKKMKQAAKELELEEAAMYRDKLKELKELEVFSG